MDPGSIRLVGLFFGIGVAPTGPLLESVAKELVKRGHRVEVLTGDVEYNRGGATAKNALDVDVHTLGSGSGEAAGFRGRFVSWLKFYLACAWFAAIHPVPAKTVIMTTPPYLHIIFVVRNWFAGRPSQLVLWNQDTYPEILASVGIVRPGSLTFKILAFAQRFGTRRADKTIVLDAAMKRILEKHGAKQIRIIPNWEHTPGDTASIESVELLQAIRDAKSKFRYLVLYTGNYGWGHDLRILFDYLCSRDERDFFFLFVGGGEKWQRLADFQDRQRLSSLGIFPYVPKIQIASLLEYADFGLVALEEACVGLMSPSKIHGYLACGKPLIYVGPDGSNVSEAIRNYDCGFRVGEKDLPGFERCLARIADGEIDYSLLSNNARRGAQERYAEPVGARDVADFITSDSP
jgi:glycosyltransferase involved in cell wall biosynthesis